MDEVLQEATAFETGSISRGAGIYYAALAFLVGLGLAAFLFRAWRIT